MPNVVQKIRNRSFSPDVTGALWLLGAVVLFQISYTSVKLVSQNLASVQIVFLRGLLQTALVLPFIFKAGIGVLKTRQYKNYACRLIFGVINIVLTFYVYGKLPLAVATSIVFTRPLFMIPLAIILLKEYIGWKKGIAALLGFAGVLIILKPKPTGLNMAETAAVFAAFFLALTYIYIQKLSRTESHAAMLFYFGLACCVLTAYPACRVWKPLETADLAGVFVMAVSAAAAQYCIIRGYQAGTATVISPIDYLQIPLSVLIGHFLFHETLSLHFLSGVAIIIATSVYILRCGTQKKTICAGNSTKEAFK